MKGIEMQNRWDSEGCYFDRQSLERTYEAQRGFDMALDGITYAVQEIDQEITSHIPELKKRKCTPRVMAEVDALLDTRNDLTSVLGGIMIEDFERTVQ